MANIIHGEHEMGGSTSRENLGVGGSTSSIPRSPTVPGAGVLSNGGFSNPAALHMGPSMNMGSGSPTPHITYHNTITSPSGERCIWVLDPMTRKLLVPVNYLVPTQATQTPGTVPSLCIAYLENRCRHPWCRQAHVIPSTIHQLRRDALNAPTCCACHGDAHDIGCLTSRFETITIADCTNKSLIPANRVALTVGLQRHLAHNVVPNATTNSASCSPNLCSSSSVAVTPAKPATTTPAPKGGAEEQPAGNASPMSTLGNTTNSTTNVTLLTATGTNLEIPSKLICRLHLSHRCRYLEDCNNIHLCRELDLHLLPPSHLVGLLCAINLKSPHVVIGDQAYGVSVLHEGEADDEQFELICENHHRNVIREHQYTLQQYEAAEEERLIAIAAQNGLGTPSPIIAGASGVSNASTPAFTFVSPPGAMGGTGAFQLSAGRYNLRGSSSDAARLGPFYQHGPPPPLPDSMQQNDDDDDLMLDDAVRASQQVALRSDPTTPQKTQMDGHPINESEEERGGGRSALESGDEYDLMGLPMVMGRANPSSAQPSNKTVWGSFTVTAPAPTLTSIVGGAGGGSTGAMTPASGIVSPPPFMSSTNEISSTSVAAAPRPPASSQGVSPELMGAIPQTSMAGIMLPPPGFISPSAATGNNPSGTSPLSLSVSPFLMEGGKGGPAHPFPSAPANSFVSNIGYGNNTVPQPQPHPVYTKVFDVKQIAVERAATGSIPVTPLLVAEGSSPQGNTLNSSTHASPYSDLFTHVHQSSSKVGKPSPVLYASVSSAASAGKSPPPPVPSYGEGSQPTVSSRPLSYRGSPTAFGIPHPLHKGNDYSLPPPQSMGSATAKHHDPSTINGPTSKGGPSPIVPVGFSSSSHSTSSPASAYSHTSHLAGHHSSTAGSNGAGGRSRVVTSPPPIESLLPAGAPAHTTVSSSTGAHPKGTPTYSQVLLNGRAHHNHQNASILPHTDHNASINTSSTDTSMPAGAPMFSYPTK